MRGAIPCPVARFNSAATVEAASGINNMGAAIYVMLHTIEPSARLESRPASSLECRQGGAVGGWFVISKNFLNFYGDGVSLGNERLTGMFGITGSQERPGAMVTFRCPSSYHASARLVF